MTNMSRLSALRSLNLSSNQGFCGAIATLGETQQGIPPFSRAYGSCTGQAVTTAQAAGPPAIAEAPTVMHVQAPTVL